MFDLKYPTSRVGLTPTAELNCILRPSAQLLEMERKVAKSSFR